MKFLFIILLIISLYGCFVHDPEPLFIYKYAELVKIQPVKIYSDCPGFYIYWIVKGSGITYEPLYMGDTTGMGLHIGMKSWVPLKR